ncbi:MAG: methionine--tRNA ligase [Actinomycetota bacterium]|nr:methionine--tRNA ligase [Actinomycetota bacterium]MDA3009048.1 methionine--tRNA ligase [Actinomycetota bacterium]MDA3037666.1 methionine--tRNA ligase [Actinomycetota bacterium]
MSKNILVSVAWPYASGSRHLGHIGGAYLPADIFARYHRTIGNKVLMVSGSDVHGTPITVRADAEGVQPIDIVNKYHTEFLGYWEKIGISWDNYTTTMTDTHIEVVHDIFNNLLNKGLIDKQKSLQAYDASEDRFLPDRYVEGVCPHCEYKEARGDQCDNCSKTLDPEELINPISKLSGNKAEFKETEHFFLKLTALENELGKWLEQQEGWRPHVINWAKSFVKDGLQDRAITRDLDWGIKIPVDDLGPGKKIYVWFEAVIGYLSASKEWASLQGDSDSWKEWWENPEAESYYFIGKDNVPFHAVIWPSILLGYKGLNLPTNVPANQYILIKGEKASASRGVGKSLDDYLDEWNPDALRYALASVFPEQADSEISEQEMIRRNNEELVAAWGNLVQRVFAQINNNFDKLGEISDIEEKDSKLIFGFEEAYKKIGNLIEKVELKSALQESMRCVSQVNAYLNETEPWKIIKDDTKRAGRVLYTSLQAIDSCANLLYPFMPTTSENVRNAIPKTTECKWGVNEIKRGAELEQLELLFKKFD